MAINLNNSCPPLSAPVAHIPGKPMPAGGSPVPFSRRTRTGLWTATYVLIDALSVAALWIPLFNMSLAFDRYRMLDLTHKFLALALIVALYSSISLTTRGGDETRIFDVRHSASRLAISSGLAFTIIILIVFKFPQHVDPFVAVRTCLFATSGLLMLAMVRTGMTWVISRAIIAGRVHVFEAINVGMQCDPTPSFQSAYPTGKHVRVAHNVRVENARDLVALSVIIARQKIDCIYVSSVWNQAPAVARYLRVLQRTSCCRWALSSSCLAVRPMGIPPGRQIFPPVCMRPIFSRT
jgi:hypothetical protein